MPRSFGTSGATIERVAGAGFRLVTRIEEWCLAWGILGIAALTVANVGARLLTGNSLLFALELTRFLVVTVTFMGIGYAAARGRHIRMTAFYDTWTPRTRKRVALLISGGTALLFFLLAWLAARHVLGTVRTLGPVSPVLQIPHHQVYLVAPLGLLLGGIQYALAFVRNVVSDGVYLSFDMADDYESAPPHDASPPPERRTP